jgi:hypothetical protein
MAAQTVSICKFVGTITLGIATVSHHPPLQASSSPHKAIGARTEPSPFRVKEKYTRRAIEVLTHHPGRLSNRLHNRSPRPPRPPHRNQRSNIPSLPLHQIHKRIIVPPPHHNLHTLLRILSITKTVPPPLSALYIDLRFHLWTWC